MITIKLNIKDKEIELTTAEAEQIYQELSNLLGKNTLDSYPSIPQIPIVNPYLPPIYNPTPIWYTSHNTSQPQKINYSVTS